MARGRDEEDDQLLVDDTLQPSIDQPEDSVHSDDDDSLADGRYGDPNDSFTEWLSCFSSARNLILMLSQYRVMGVPTHHLPEWKIPIPYNSTGRVWHRGFLVSGSQLLDYVRLHGLKDKENADRVLNEVDCCFIVQCYMDENKIPIVDIATPILNGRDRRKDITWILTVYTSEDIACDDDDNLTVPLIDKDRLRAFKEEFGIAEQEMMWYLSSTQL
ncbi:hypothetical protein BV25DRAFT_1830013 [Artomyces pyxidatus]|uniref:Uncharacterized protein n=1 Tax=Artomyces pyxidatus TaxID=48021 RepID=A0ACB8SQ54_9AGAM|nr:hypothetical protein BV25DRAFT_1830013 [Artomyces pyxidatus]